MLSPLFSAVRGFVVSSSLSRSRRREHSDPLSKSPLPLVPWRPSSPMVRHPAHPPPLSAVLSPRVRGIPQPLPQRPRWGTSEPQPCYPPPLSLILSLSLSLIRPPLRGAKTHENSPRKILVDPRTDDASSLSSFPLSIPSVPLSTCLTGTTVVCNREFYSLLGDKGGILGCRCGRMPSGSFWVTGYFSVASFLISLVSYIVGLKRILRAIFGCILYY